MKRLEDIIQTLSSIRTVLEQKYAVKEIGLFGSYVRREQKESSDVDVLVEFNRPVSLLHIVALENYLSDALGIKVDVVPRKNIREELRDSILRETIPV